MCVPLARLYCAATSEKKKKGALPKEEKAGEDDSLRHTTDRHMHTAAYRHRHRRSYSMHRHRHAHAHMHRDRHMHLHKHTPPTHNLTHTRTPTLTHTRCIGCASWLGCSAGAMGCCCHRRQTEASAPVLEASAPVRQGPRPKWRTGVLRPPNERESLCSPALAGHPTQDGSDTGRFRFR